MIIPAWWPQLRSYLIAGAAVAALCSGVTALTAWQMVRTQKATITAKDEVIAKQEARLDDLAAGLRAQATLRALDRQAELELREQLDGLAASDAETLEQLKELEETNEDVRDYLSRPIPDELRRLFQTG